MGVTVTYKGNTIASMNASGSKTLLTSGKYCEDNISVYYQGEQMPNYRKYEGTIDSDVVGSYARALLLTSDDIAQHYADPSFKCAVYFTPNPEAAYSVLQVTGYNVANQEPYRAINTANSMQYTFREGADIGSFNGNAFNLSVSDASSDNYVGRIQCDSQGNLYVWSGSANYGIRKGVYKAEIWW